VPEHGVRSPLIVVPLLALIRKALAVIRNALAVIRATLALIGTLVAFVSGSFTLLGELLTPIRAALVLIRTAVASVSGLFTFVFDLLALVGETVSFVYATLSLGQSLPQLRAARSIRFRAQLIGVVRRLVTTGRIPTVRRSVAHHFSMRPAERRRAHSP
jgi:hypothetical protein